MVEAHKGSGISFTVEGSTTPSTVTSDKARPQPRAALAVELREHLWLAASPTRAWLSDTAPDTTQAIGTPAIRSLLEGAVAAACSLCPSRPPLSIVQWTWRLVGYCHLTHSAPALLDFAAERFAADGHSALAQWARARAYEQASQHLLVLADLRALRLDAARTIAALRPHPAERLIAWLRASVVADPTACLGYVLAVERLALPSSAAEFGPVQTLLPELPGCLRGHAEHLDETIALLGRLSATRCEVVARAVFEAACLCMTPSFEQLDDATIAGRLSGSCELQH